MKRILLDYSMLSSLSNPGIKKSEREKSPFFSYMNREPKMQAVCFDFQLQAINITSYKRKAIEEEINLRGFEHIMIGDGYFADEEEKLILERQHSIVERFNKKSERISSRFSNGLANSISSSFMLPGHIVKLSSTHFIDEDDLKQFNIEVIPLNKAELVSVLNYINQWKESDNDSVLSDLLLLDIITRMLCGLNKLDEWFLIDSNDRVKDLNEIYNNSLFQNVIRDCKLFPTIIR